MIEIRMTGVVASEPKERVVEHRSTKVRVRVNVIDAKGKVQWIDCNSTDPAMCLRLSMLCVGDCVEIQGNPSWVFYLKADRETQGLQTQVTVSVLRRLSSAIQPQPSKEAA